MGPSGASPIGRPWVSAAGLGLAVGAGLLWFRLGGAPAQYLPVNAAALGIALVLMLALPAQRGTPRGAIAIVALCALGIAATLFVGEGSVGVHRWLPLGPLRLHAAMLLLPSLAVALLQLDARWRAAVLVALAFVFVLQPDFASALALAMASVAVARGVGLWALLSSGFAVATAVWTWVAGDALTPIPFVEGVLGDAYQRFWAHGAHLAGLLFVAVVAPLRDPSLPRAGSIILVATVAGFALASVTGRFPTPFVGFGAAPIIGFGLGVAVLRWLGPYPRLSQG